MTVGVDTGSTHCKVVGVDPGGDVIARSVFSTPRDDRGWIAADALLARFEAALRSIAGGRRRIAAIAATGIGEDGTIVDAEFSPRAAAMPWFDPRRASVFDGVCHLDDTRTGVVLEPSRTLVSWEWNRLHQPEILSRAGTWIALTDYPLAAWTGVPFITDNLASRTAAWDPWARAWMDERVHATLGEHVGVPATARSGDVIGEVRAAAVADLFAPGAVAVAAGHDHPVTGWAVDRAAPGSVVDSMGTAEIVTRQAADLPRARPPGLDVAPGIGHTGATLLAVSELARNTEFARRTRPDISAELDRLLAAEELPPFAPPEVFRAGGQGGQSAQWLPGSESMSPSDLAYGVLWSCADALTAATRQLREIEQQAGDVYAAGGWTRSPGWILLKERSLGVPLRLIGEREATATAAALLAGRAIGWDQDPVRALRPHSRSAHL